MQQPAELRQRDEYLNFLTLAWLEARQRHGPFPRGSELNVEPLPLDIWLEAVETGPRSDNLAAPPAFVMLSRYDESMLDMIHRTMDTLRQLEDVLTRL
jgi:hypothetical protein